MSPRTMTGERNWLIDHTEAALGALGMRAFLHDPDGNNVEAVFRGG